MESEESISLVLYDALDKIGVSEILRRKYQECGIRREILKSLAFLENVIMYNFGSRCEGTTTPGLQSDMDILMCSTTYYVFEELIEAPNKGFAALIDIDNEIASGYVKLQVVNDGKILSEYNDGISKPEGVMGIRLHESGKYFWTCDFKFQNNVYRSAKKTGPAINLEPISMVPSDNVFALRCRRWPSFANEWVSRKRNNSWPDKNVVCHLKTLGFFVVRVGHPHSKNENLEWRVSFSLQERQLMFTLTDIQYKCYVMLKLINHDLIKKKIGRSITSYHCKTCLFYAIEQNPKSIWVSQNLFKCVIKCLNILLEWARNGNCPNYFIPNENMFEGKVIGETRIKVMEILNKLLTERVVFLKRIQTDELGVYVFERDDESKIKATEQHSYLRTSSTQYELQTETIQEVLGARLHLLRFVLIGEESEDKTVPKTDTERILRAIDTNEKLLDWLKRVECVSEHSIADSKDMINLLLPFLHTSLACHRGAYALQCDDVSILCENQCLSLVQFNKGMHSDLTSSRLKFITYLYKCGKDHQCEQELICLEKELKPYVCSFPECRDSIRDMNTYLQAKLLDQDYCPGYVLKHFTSACVIFLPTETDIIPDALKFEMFRSTGTLPESRIMMLDFWYEWVVVESKAYIYFLQYLLSRKRNDLKAKQYSFLEKVVETINDPIFQKETIFNLLVWAFMQENLLPQAMRYMVHCWKICKKYNVNLRGNTQIFLHHHNAVKWHMLLLLRQIWLVEKCPRYDIIFSISFCFKCFKQNFSVRLMKCSFCKIAEYCSQNCQQGDLDAHRKVCELFS